MERVPGLRGDVKVTTTRRRMRIQVNCKSWAKFSKLARERGLESPAHIVQYLALGEVSR